MSRPLILLAAGGTGGHLFPAEALGAVLRGRGYDVHLVTDHRAQQYGGAFEGETLHVVPSETVRGRDPFSLAKSGVTMATGIAKALMLIRKLKPVLVVGFGGYPTVPPLLAASFLRVPTLIHDANAVMGRANRFLAPRTNAIATSFDGILRHEPSLAAKATMTGNPLRPAVLSACAVSYEAPQPSGELRLVVFGGSQGARVMADIVPPAIEHLEPALWDRLRITQQVRDEDIARTRAIYDKLKVRVELAPFFTDLPQRLAQSHLVISRSGAGTVAELAAMGRPAILVPLPGALDQDQFANAGVLEAAGGAIRIVQSEFSPARLAAEISALGAEPARLAAMAQAARGAGRQDAAEKLADLAQRLIHA